jgi:uncharacterized iron-regulated membrane protein
MTARKIVLQVHLYLGVAAAIFLAILGVTGSIIAFEGDIDHWLHSRLWYVTPGAGTLPESALIAGVERQFAPARVRAILIARQRNPAQLMALSDRSTVTVNPYDGAILGRRTGPTRADRWLGYIHQIHLRLAGDGRAAWAPAGKTIVSYAGLALCLLVPTGVILWWRTRRTAMQWKASWFRTCFDAHRWIGIYAAVFLWVAAFTSVLIGFDSAEKAIYALTHSSRPSFAPPPHSTPFAGAPPFGVDRAIAVAQQTLPGAALDTLILPGNPKDAFDIGLRVPEETSGSAHSSVAIDQYSGKVLQVRNFLTDSEGYRWIRFNRSIHTGDIWGLPGHILMSVSSLLLVAMVVTGVVIRVKKLAV